MKRSQLKQGLSKSAASVWQSLLALGGRNRDEYEFMPGYLEIAERPPAPLARGLALLMSLLLILALLWAIFGRLDIHARANGHLLVPGRSKMVQAHDTGEVTAIHVRDGQRVMAGQALIELNPTGVGAELQELQTQLLSKRLQLAKAQALLSSAPIQNYQPPEGVDEHQLTVVRDQLRSAWEEIRANREGLQAEIAVNQASQKVREVEIVALGKLAKNIGQRLAARRALAAEQMLAQVELLEQEKELLEVQRTLAGQVAEVSVLKAQARNREQQLESLRARVTREQQDAVISARQDIAIIQQQIVRLHDRQRLQILRAPVDGVVQQLAVHTLGGRVQLAQQLVVIVPDGTDLEAEVLVLNKDVGFVKAGQTVEVKVDAYPYTRFGTLLGTLEHVSPDAVKDEQQGRVFHARIQLPYAYLTNADERMPLQAGMSVVAEIHTGKRAVIDYLLAPIQQYQSEALRER